jgi:hypothetical protein
MMEVEEKESQEKFAELDEFEKDVSEDYYSVCASHLEITSSSEQIFCKRRSH